MKQAATRSESAARSGGNGSGNGRSKGPRKERRHVSFSVVMKETTLERYRRKEAARALRNALAPHDQVVKVCVAERLCHHLSREQLADKCGLSEGQVEDILERMRPWVHRFTTFFDSDWYWMDGGAPSVPAPSRN